MKVILVSKGKKSKAKEMESLPENSLRNVWTDSGCTCYMDEESLPVVEDTLTLKVALPELSLEDKVMMLENKISELEALIIGDNNAS